MAGENKVRGKRRMRRRKRGDKVTRTEEGNRSTSHSTGQSNVIIRVSKQENVVTQEDKLQITSFFPRYLNNKISFLVEVWNWIRMLFAFADKKKVFFSTFTAPASRQAAESRNNLEALKKRFTPIASLNSYCI